MFLNCGHRGQPSRLEEKRISRLLRKSLFIPLLEDMQSQDQVKKSAIPVPKFVANATKSSDSLPSA